MGTVASVIIRAELLGSNAASDLVSILLAPFREIPVGRTAAERPGRIRGASMCVELIFR